MYSYGLDHREVGEQFFCVNRLPPNVWGRELIVWMIDIIGSRENGDNGGENREEYKEVESPDSKYGGFWFVFILKNGWDTYNLIHVYGRGGHTHAHKNVSKIKMGIETQMMGADQYIYN